MTRYRAALIHFSASAVIAAAVAILVAAFWYPGPFLHISGGFQLIALVIGCDVVLGPVMTLIIFDTTKRNLKFDLVCIVLIQFAALVYGIHVAATARPAFAVMNSSSLDVLPANDLLPEDFSGATSPFDRIGWSGPQFAVIRPHVFSPKPVDSGTVAAYSAWDPSVVRLAGTSPSEFKLQHGGNEDLLDKLDSALRQCKSTTESRPQTRIVVYTMRLSAGWAVLAPPQFKPCAAF